MGRFDKILIVTDLDGTLYRNDKSVSQENKQAIEYFKREGGYFTFITGRLPYYSQDAYRTVAPNAPFGCINGGGVYDGQKKQYVWHLTLAPRFKELVESIDKAFPEVGIQLCTPEKTYVAKDNEVTAWFRRATDLPHLTCPYQCVTESVAKVIFCTDREQELLAVEQALRSHPLADEFSFVRSEKKLFEILPKGVHKGLSLGKIAEHLGIEKKNTLAVGDYDNDVGMFLAAGLGIAVENASERAKQAARRITVSNQEHALARIIDELDRGIIVL